MNFLRNRISWRFKLAILLIILSVIIYIIQYLVFQDLKTELFYFGIDLAFLPVEALIIILVIERVISEREKRSLLEKLNMVIGSFFSEVGTDLMRGISDFDTKTGKIRKNSL